MTKLIISKTIIFIAVVGFVGIFSTVFTSINSLVGVATVILSLSLLERNLAKHPIKNLFILIGGNLVLGLAAFMTTLNPYLGLVINFSVIFLFTYSFSYRFRKSLSTLVALHYLFLIMTPVSMVELSTRLIGLIAMSCMILFVNVMVNKNKLQKTTPKLLKIIEENLLLKANGIIRNQDLTAVNEIIDSNIKQLKIINFNAIEKDSSMTEYGQLVSGILSCYEKIDYLLDSTTDATTLQHGTLILTIINELCEDDLSKKLNEIQDLDDYEWVKTFKILKNHKNLLAQLNHENDIKQIAVIPKQRQPFLDIHSMRFGYSLRLALLMAATLFVSGYFKLELGYWMACSVLSITQFHGDYAVIKAKKRIYGTVIGSILVLILFSLIQDFSMRTVVLLVAGYLMSYMNDYKNKAIFITLCSICSAAILVPSPTMVVAQRFVYTVIGISVALVVNKYVFAKRKEDEILELLNVKSQIKDYMLQETLSLEQTVPTQLHDLYLMSSLIEDRINHSELNDCKHELSTYKKAINQMHQLYLDAQHNEKTKQTITKIQQMINFENKEHIIESLKQQMNQTECLIEKLVYSQVSAVIKSMN